MGILIAFLLHQHSSTQIVTRFANAHGMHFSPKTVVPDMPTMTPEWKEAEARYEIENKMNPFTGPYAEYRKKLEAEEAKAAGKK